MSETLTFDGMTFEVRRSARRRTLEIIVDRGGELRIAAPPDPVWAIFLTTGLDKIFEFTPDVSTALAALKMSPDEA